MAGTTAYVVAQFHLRYGSEQPTLAQLEPGTPAGWELQKLLLNLSEKKENPLYTDFADRQENRSRKKKRQRTELDSSYTEGDESPGLVSSPSSTPIVSSKRRRQHADESPIGHQAVCTEEDPSDCDTVMHRQQENKRTKRRSSRKRDKVRKKLKYDISEEERWTTRVSAVESDIGAPIPEPEAPDYSCDLVSPIAASSFSIPSVVEATTAPFVSETCHPAIALQAGPLQYTQLAPEKVVCQRMFSWIQTAPLEDIIYYLHTHPR